MLRRSDWRKGFSRESFALRRVYGTEVSPDTVSTITDEVLEEVKAWQRRPLDEVSPDRLRRRADGEGPRRRPGPQQGLLPRRGGQHLRGQARPRYLGAADRGAKFWMQVCTEVRERGER